MLRSQRAQYSSVVQHSHASLFPLHATLQYNLCMTVIQ